MKPKHDVIYSWQWEVCKTETGELKSVQRKKINAGQKLWCQERHRYFVSHACSIRKAFSTMLKFWCYVLMLSCNFILISTHKAGAYPTWFGKKNSGWGTLNFLYHLQFFCTFSYVHGYVNKASWNIMKELVCQLANWYTGDGGGIPCHFLKLVFTFSYLILTNSVSIENGKKNSNFKTKTISLKAKT